MHCCFLDFMDPWDEDVCKGINEVKKTNYIKALKRFEAASSLNNEFVLVFAASIHFMGFKYVTRNLSKALDLYQKAVEKRDNPVAQYMLAMVYPDGNTVKRSEKNVIC
jgi:TPR repeat protein